MSNITNVWTATTTYPPGSSVRPTSPTGAAANPPADGDFETGPLFTSAWAQISGPGTFSIVSATGGVNPYTGSKMCQLTSGSATPNVAQAAKYNGAVAYAATGPGNAGQKITAWGYVNFGAATANASVSCQISLYTSGFVLLGTLTGVAVSANTAGAGWQRFIISDVPVLIGTAFVRIGFSAINNSGQPIYFDGFGWDLLVNPYDNPLLFFAVQTGTGKSGAVEPIWKDTVAHPPNINDGTVIWSSQAPVEIVWLCEPLLKSGSVEPTWPLVVGQSVHEQTGLDIDWLTLTPQVTDPQCPQTKYVTMAVSKIFAGNNDTVNYSATLNAMDWSSEANAGFINTGGQAYGDNPVAALGLYRGNLVVFNVQGFQLWAVDEDPANMQPLDAKPIGCRFHRSVTPINDDLFFLTDVGLRSMGISAASGELMAGDVGMPIDPIVKDALAYINATPGAVDQLSTIYYPGAGQFWMAVPGWVPSANVFAANPATLPAGVGTYNKLAYDAGTHVLVYTQSRIGEVGAWSHYLFPCTIDAFAILDSKLYISSGDYILYVDPTVVSDLLTYNVTGSVAGALLLFPCIVQWPWLDMGTPGSQKKMLGFEFEADNTSGPIRFAFGYDQSNPATFTGDFECSPGDSLPGQPIPLALNCASVSPRITLSSYYDWKFNRLIVYTADEAVGK